MWSVVGPLCARARHCALLAATLKHVQLLQESHVGGEKEYLFSAFSVFTVREIEHSPTPTDPTTPHRITLEVALDNALFPTDMDLAPWC